MKNNVIVIENFTRVFIKLKQRQHNIEQQNKCIKH